MRVVCAVCLAAVSVASGLQGQETKTALDKLQGKWSVVAMERDGRASPKAHCDSLQVTIAGDKMTLGSKDGKGPMLEHEIRLDAKNPRVMDLVITSGAGKGKVLLGIYECDGKALKMCHADAAAKNRPTEFKSPEGVYFSVMIVERAPK